MSDNEIAMKLLFKENKNIDYAQYEFPYCVYAIKEEGDSYSDIYAQGFLPYSNDLSIADEIYYLARSVRIRLTDKLFTYKQNNVFNNFKPIFATESLRFELVDKELLMDNPEFRKWCLENAKNQFLTEERLDYILTRKYLKKILLFYAGEELLAYIFVVTEEKMLHLWYSFYDLKKALNNLGKWVILNVIKWCKSEGYNYFYIGTCYSSSAFYKLTLSPDSEYFTGSEWSADITSLKRHLLDGEK